MSHHTKTLSECPNGYVGYCDCCARYNVSFNNSLFIFSDIEFAGFRQFLTDRTGISPFLTTHGKEVIVQTPMKNYYLVFSEPEIQQLLDMIIQASLIVETNQILSQTGCGRKDGN